MLQLNQKIKKPYYVQIYEYYRREIEAGHLLSGMRLESVRELAQNIGVSKMTVEKAYYQLASEGYILRRHKARYEVAFLGMQEEASGKTENKQPRPLPKRPVYAYDFASGDMALDRFPLEIWRKYMNQVLSSPEQLLAANDDQGVPELRRVLSRYVYETRGVHAEPQQIVIGAGTVPLLGILTQILRPKYSHIGVEDPGFRLGREVFRNSGYSIVPIPISQGLLQVEALEKSQVGLVYVSPSHQFPTGTVMPAGTRHRLLSWAQRRDGLIIEDDYDSELRYYGRPVPALQGLDHADRVVYMGALSKVLPFFIRLSYMVLPAPLLPLYEARRSFFRQGASVPEQCVLAKYIQSGELARQVRRLRKEYQEKGTLLAGLLVKAFGEKIIVGRLVSGVYCHIRLRSEDSEQRLLEKAEARGCRVLSMQSFYETPSQETDKEFLLSFAKIPSEKLCEAVAALHSAWS